MVKCSSDQKDSLLSIYFFYKNLNAWRIIKKESFESCLYMI